MKTPSIIHPVLRHLLLLFGIFSLGFTTQAQTREIALRAGDTFRFSIGGVPAEEAAMMNQTYTIRENGTVKLSYLPEVQAAGIKPSDLARKIEQLYISGEIYTNPSCNISIDTVKDDPNRVVYVTGEVKNPAGAVTYRPGLTAFQAVGMAGGVTAFGKLSKVSFVRRSESGQLITRTLDLRNASSPDASLEVLPGDQLTVPN